MRTASLVIGEVGMLAAKQSRKSKSVKNAKGGKMTNEQGVKICPQCSCTMCESVGEDGNDI